MRQKTDVLKRIAAIGERICRNYSASRLLDKHKKCYRNIRRTSNVFTHSFFSTEEDFNLATDRYDTARSGIGAKRVNRSAERRERDFQVR